MNLLEAKEILDADLPSSMQYVGDVKPNYYLVWNYTDPSGDVTKVQIDIYGKVCTFEVEANCGTQWSIKATDFMWRASRVIRDLPW